MKKVLVTGAAGGMGRAVCALLSQSGYEVWGLDRAFPEGKNPCHCVTADLTKEEDIHAAFSRIRQEIDGLYAIVHMAGIYDLGSLAEMPEDRFRRIFEVNFFAVYRVNKIFLPLLKKGGRIVITSSELAPLDPLPFTGLYGISKTAVEKYAFSLRMELQLLGYQVSILRPGAVRTNLLEVSTNRLEEFCQNTKLYSCNARRFQGIVNRVEAKNIPAQKLAKRLLKILSAKRPAYIYSINRNPLLRLLNLLPPRMQTWIIGKVLS